jgi:hypothetical protein
VSNGRYGGSFDEWISLLRGRGPGFVGWGEGFYSFSVFMFVRVL